MERRDKVTIKIPRPLYKNLQKIIEGTGFSSVTEFATFVLRDIASGRTEELSSEEISKIKERLKKLGYI
ncbi:MAG TPA: CopG family transcriptional regulator [Candidatus Omnitrophica bacterium]|nr:CopG family transcriptional regulator [Candidatus Omnitrophota bacterium]